MRKTRILFVDDEPKILSGLQRMLRGESQRWDMVFCTNAQEALDRMAQQPFDVIVTDIRMSGMTGTELLRQVIERYPSTARIVLSGSIDESLARQTVRLAHQYLCKPTDAEALKRAVSTACKLPEMINNERVRQAVARCATLPSPPENYLRLVRVLDSENADARQVAQIVSHDPAMSMKILQLVNSSFFGIGRRISSIEQTVTLLGFLRIRALVLTQHIFEKYSPSEYIPGFSIVGLWEHSLSVAELARQISTAEGQKGDRPDQAYTAGLLHDIGMLVLASQYPSGFVEIMRERPVSVDNMLEIERQQFSVTHAELGAHLLALWLLPARIVEAVALHHTPSQVSYDGLCAVTVVHMADALEARACGTDLETCSYADGVELDEGYLKRVGLWDRRSAYETMAAQIVKRRELVKE